MKIIGGVRMLFLVLIKKSLQSVINDVITQNIFIEVISCIVYWFTDVHGRSLVAVTTDISLFRLYLY